eukprot:3301898-Pyramimonas_sp.AAC.1
MVFATARAARKGPRHLGAAGQLAPPAWPARGLPQGDALAPAALRAVLAPWQPINGIAYMGDGSVANVSADPVRDDLRAGSDFDRAVGFKENVKKG